MKRQFTVNIVMHQTTVDNWLTKKSLFTTTFPVFPAAVNTSIFSETNFLMRKCIMLLGIVTHLNSGKAQQEDYNKYPVYTGNDLGLTYTKTRSAFRIWSPPAEDAELIFYTEGTGGTESARHSMNKGENGEWHIHINGDQKGKFYVFRVKTNNKWMDEVPDPYARAVGVNGRRAMVVDPDDTNPADWKKDKSPLFQKATDAIIYELHVRDASISPNSGTKHRGKYLGLTETGTKNPDGLSTGLDHIRELGITHVHLLPCFDFNSIDETKPHSKYNWGYDPLNYNVPEGSYSTNPYDGITRIREFKQLIKTFHENGLRVVMDVAYNHTGLTESSYFNQLVPGYYYRHTKDGKFSNATACGNETASERPMMRKFMLESMQYWVEEYHVDGFRIDLMGVHDIETMNLISAKLHKIRPDILLYGEGWTAGPSPLPDSLRAIKANASKLNGIAVFSDDIRDGIKGHVFKHDEKGFASGKPGTEESVKFGIVASCNHPQVNYSKVNYSKAAYAAEPWQTITYCECHDNHCLWDKLAISAKDASKEERINMQKLALSIVLTSQGIAFLHAGTEFLRTKRGVENSFESPDRINAIDWSLKSANREVLEYVKALIRLRKEHSSFRMNSAKRIAEKIRFDEMPAGMICYNIYGRQAGEKWKTIKVIFNGTSEEEKILYSGMWRYAVRNNNFVTDKKEYSGEFILAPYSASILYQKD